MAKIWNFILSRMLCSAGHCARNPNPPHGLKPADASLVSHEREYRIDQLSQAMSPLEIMNVLKAAERDSLDETNPYQDDPELRLEARLWMVLRQQYERFTSDQAGASTTTHDTTTRLGG